MSDATFSPFIPTNELTSVATNIAIFKLYSVKPGNLCPLVHEGKLAKCLLLFYLGLQK